jgi:AraC family transcriptional regulator
MKTATPQATGRCVYDVLGASRARLERACALGDGLRLAQWHNHDDAPVYTAPGHHTISVYLAGGFGTYLAGRPTLRGSPGRVCVLPAEHESRWVVEGELRFLHLYVSDLAWADRVVRLIDAEPRAVTLDERIFAEDPRLAQWAGMLANEVWDSADSRLRINSASHAALDHLVLAAAQPLWRSAALRPRGGLSAPARRRVIDWVEAHLPEDFTLADLAAQAALSEFHFARMFRASMGVTPHAWVAQRRFARACELLRGNPFNPPPLERVAAACGYTHASHLSRRFRETLGVTPAQYRKR